MVAYEPMPVPTGNSTAPHGTPEVPFVEQLRYWAKRLDGVLPLELSISQPRPDGTPSGIGEHSYSVPRDVTARLLALTTQFDVTLLDLTVAVFQVILARHSGEKDIVVATPAPDRNIPFCCGPAWTIRFHSETS